MGRTFTFDQVMSMSGMPRPPWADDEPDEDPDAWLRKSPVVKTKPGIVFIEPGEKGINAVTQTAAAAADPVKVKVKSPFRIVHDGSVHTGGDVIEVPFETADHWVKRGWAERTPIPRKATSVKGEK